MRTLLCVLLIFITACDGLKRIPDYKLKISKYGGRDDLTIREKQMLYMAEKKERAK